MDTGVVLTQVAGAGFDLANLSGPSDGHEHSRPNGVAVAPLPHQANQKGVVPVTAVVPQEIGGLTVVGCQQVEVPVIVDIGDGKRSTDLLHGEAAPRRPPLLDEAASAGVVEQQPALRVLRSGAHLRRVVDDVAVRDGDVEPAVVVVVEERCAEADEWQRREREAALAGRIDEQPPAQIAKQRRRLELVIRHDQIQPAVAVVVAKIGAHARARLAVVGDGNAGKEPPLVESSVAVVAIQRVRQGIVRDEDVGPAVVVVVGNHDAQAVAAR